jgi:hypothetical protein
MSVVLESELENWMGTDHSTRLGKYESRCCKVELERRAITRKLGQQIIRATGTILRWTFDGDIQLDSFYFCETKPAKLWKRVF